MGEWFYTMWIDFDASSCFEKKVAQEWSHINWSISDDEIYDKLTELFNCYEHIYDSCVYRYLSYHDVFMVK